MDKLKEQVIANAAGKVLMLIKLGDATVYTDAETGGTFITSKSQNKTFKLRQEVMDYLVEHNLLEPEGNDAPGLSRH